MSDDSCFSRIAAARPAGPAPTTTTSNSIDSRAGMSIAYLRRAPARRGAVFPRLPDRRNDGGRVFPAVATHGGFSVNVSATLGVRFLRLDVADSSSVLVGKGRGGSRGRALQCSTVRPPPHPSLA